jgi:nucleoside-diphosphate kinase
MIFLLQVTKKREACANGISVRVRMRGDEDLRRGFQKGSYLGKICILQVSGIKIRCKNKDFISFIRQMAVFVTIRLISFILQMNSLLLRPIKFSRMKGNRTFTMIKPSAVQDGHSGKIINMFIEGGFRIIALKYTRLSREQAGAFYEVHKERPFYNDLVEFMSSGPIFAAILEKDNAVEDFRKLIGSTDPAKAEAGTVRKLYGLNVQENAVHGSDSDENAIIEGNFFFSAFERF